MKIGDYVRTKKGIGKITNISICDDFKVISTDNFNMNVFTKNKCKRTDLKFKSSPNIIDLIEFGDYVNGIKVDFTHINNKLSYEDKCIGFYDGDGDITLFEKDIKSIVTKEQFENMEYKVGEDNDKYN